MSSFKEIRIPSRTSGKAVLKVRVCIQGSFELVMEPFYEAISNRVVGSCTQVFGTARRFENSRQRCDSNCLPLSVVTVEGVPNWVIQVWMKAQATVSALLSGI